MANHNFQEKVLNLNQSLVWLQGNFTVGASGAVSLVNGSGITSVTKLGTGTYLIALDGTYNRFLACYAGFIGPTTGSDVTDGSFSANATYRITAVGNTNWAAAGLPSAFTATVGQTFVAANVGGAGTGTAKLVVGSSVCATEVADTNVQESVQLGVGVLIHCYDYAGALVNPASGALCNFTMHLRNSSLKGKGE